jgi:EAL domain-containing protein (putative c-di-GMP-specific phosphodiesterase class I)
MNKIVKASIRTGFLLQPIIDKEYKVFAYEVLYRAYFRNNKLNTIKLINTIRKNEEHYISFIKKYFKNLYFFLREQPPKIKKIFINISLYYDINNDKIFALLRKELKRIQTLGYSLVVELVESDDYKMPINYDIKRKINYLKKQNIEIAIDDYGTGNSNCDKLVFLECEYIKIDGLLLKESLKNNKAYEIIKSIIKYANNTKTKIIFEFIENEKILKQVKKLDIKTEYFLQGYMFNEQNIRYF